MNLPEINCILQWKFSAIVFSEINFSQNNKIQNILTQEFREIQCINVHTFRCSKMSKFYRNWGNFCGLKTFLLTKRVRKLNTQDRTFATGVTSVEHKNFSTRKILHMNIFNTEKFPHYSNCSLRNFKGSSRKRITYTFLF